jgi:hypothetical protein
MEFLGHFTEVKTNNKKRAIDLFYPTVELFCDATSKLIEGFKEECKFVVANEEGDRYFLTALDYRYISEENTIRIFPESLRKYQKK